MVDIVPPPTTDINIYLRQGAANFHSGRHQAAFDAFEMALKLAKQQGDCSAERVCKQNIGALYIAVSQPDEGLQHLLTALPSGNEAVDPQSLGDLYFNLGTGYEMIGNLPEASRHFIASAKEYHIIEECVVQEAEAYTRGAQLLQQLGGPLKAARMFHLAADCYMKVSDYVYAATNLCQEANSLITIGSYDDGLRAATDCMILCQRITSYEMRAKLYNEVGVLYSQCGEFGRAAACLELALPKHKIDQNDKRLEALIRQNLGAVYNCLNEFGKALPLHLEALRLQEELGNRHAQCEIELNIAYAHTQLSDFNSAAIHYELSNQAAHDTGDKHSQWQAMEGLAAAKFRQGDINSAVTLYKEALHALAKSSEKNVVANERLVAKLNDALQAKLFNSKGALAGGADKAAQDNKTIGADNKLPANSVVKPNDTRTPADVEVMQRADIRLDSNRNTDKPPQQEQISLGLRETNIVNGSREASSQNGKLPLTNGNRLPKAPSGSVGDGMSGQQSHEQSTDNSRLSHRNQQDSKKQTKEVKMRVTTGGEDDYLKAYEAHLRAKEREDQEGEDDDVDEQVKYSRTQQTVVVSQGPITETQSQPPANASPLIVHVSANIGKPPAASYDDPTYTSVRPQIVVEGDQPEPDPVLNTTNTLVPLVPQRMAMPTNWSRGAQEEFLFRYQQQYADDKRRERSEEEVQQQSKKKSDDPSKTCNLM